MLQSPIVFEVVVGARKRTYPIPCSESIPEPIPMLESFPILEIDKITQPTGIKNASSHTFLAYCFGKGRTHL